MYSEYFRMFSSSERQLYTIFALRYLPAWCWLQSASVRVNPAITGFTCRFVSPSSIFRTIYGKSLRVTRPSNRIFRRRFVPNSLPFFKKKLLLTDIEFVRFDIWHRAVLPVLGSCKLFVDDFGFIQFSQRPGMVLQYLVDLLMEFDLAQIGSYPLYLTFVVLSFTSNKYLKCPG